MTGAGRILVAAALLGAGAFAVSSFAQDESRADLLKLHSLLRELGIAQGDRVDTDRLHVLIADYEAAVKAGKFAASPGAARATPPPALAKEPTSKLEGGAKAARVTCVALTSDGAYVCLGREDGEVEVWDANTRERVTAAHHPSASILAVATHPFAPLVAHASETGVRFTLVKSTRRPALREGAGSCAAVAFASDGTHLATGDDQGVVTVWDLWSGTAYRHFTAGSGAVTALAFHPDGDTLAAGDADGRVTVLASAANKTLFELAAHEGGCAAVAWSPSGAWLASGGADAVVRLWGADGEAGPRFEGHAKALTALAWHPTNENALASADAAGSVRVWDTAKKIAAVELAHATPVAGLAWRKDGEALHVATGSAVLLYEARR